MSKKYMSTKISCYTGYFVQAIINNLAPLFYVTFQSEFNISYTKISWLIMINFVTQIFIDIVSIKFIERFGYRFSIIVAHVFSAVGLVLLGILPRAMSNHYLGMIIPIVIYATGSGLIEVLISPIVEGLPLDNKSGEMSLLHSFYCWGQMFVVLITTLVIRAIGSENWIYLPMLWAIIPFVNMFMFMYVPIFPPVPEGEQEMKLSELFRSKVFLVAAVLMFCAGGSEIAMSQWASTFAENSLGIDKTMGDLLGPCLFAFLMAIARVCYGMFGNKINIRHMLMGTSAFCVVVYLITTLVNVPIVSLIGCSLCGLSVSTMWPGVFSLSAASFKRGGTRMFAMLAMFGDLGCSFGPWLAGVVSDAAEKNPAITMDPLKFGLLVCTSLPLLMFLVLTFSKSVKYRLSEV